MNYYDSWVLKLKMRTKVLLRASYTSTGSNQSLAETFLVFAQTLPSRDLGFLSKNDQVQVTVGRRDFTLSQSIGLLNSQHERGTTGAGNVSDACCAAADVPVLWQVTPLLAQWLVAPNMFAATGILHPQAHVLELGCGISGLLAMALAPLVGTYFATDTGSIAGSKTLRQNLAQNAQTSKSSNIVVRSLDWESDSVARLYDEIGLGPGQQIDLVIACDCIYNEALVAPFVETCVEICRLSRDAPTACLIAQQLRSPGVFEQWLAAFHDKFRVWRVPRHIIGDALSDDSGFAVHIGLLRSA
jgi:hypothetical protein